VLIADAAGKRSTVQLQIDRDAVEVTGVFVGILDPQLQVESHLHAQAIERFDAGHAHAQRVVAEPFRTAAERDYREQPRREEAGRVPGQQPTKEGHSGTSSRIGLRLGGILPARLFAVWPVIGSNSTAEIT
jgi:hypothetical protein